MMTVVFATRNGERTLPEVLESYRHLDEPEGSWKLLVVDNASGDRSKEIILSYRDRLPLTYLYQDIPGKNAALNLAIEHIDGDLVLFTDDDIFPRPDWLIRMRCAADSHPSFEIFGGVVLPRWEKTPPDWILNWVPHDVVFAATSPELREGPTIPDLIYGGNMGIRLEILKHGFRYDPSIGPGQTTYAMGSETEFLWRLVRNGYDAWHVQDAIVEHFIREHQMQKSWILARAIRYGRGQYRMKSADHAIRTVSWFGVPRYIIRQLLEKVLEFLKCTLLRDLEKAFRARWELNYFRGNIIEARHLFKEKNP